MGRSHDHVAEGWRLADAGRTPPPLWERVLKGPGHKTKHDVPCNHPGWIYRCRRSYPDCCSFIPDHTLPHPSQDQIKQCALTCPDLEKPPSPPTWLREDLRSGFLRHSGGEGSIQDDMMSSSPSWQVGWRLNRFVEFGNETIRIRNETARSSVT